MCQHMFVITGAPGSGKSSLLEALAKQGIRYMPEAGRAIIQDQVVIKGSALPWADRSLFAELMLNWELRSYREARDMAEPILMDRGVVDVLGYLTLCNLPIPDHVKRAADQYRYNQQVFIAPYWAEIFGQDAERKQDRAEAEATYQVMARTYAELGYELIQLPLASIEERAAFVRKHILG
ncbi:AAA family ATPase [Halomonas binhaiensis]|uniref:AAA family ATPase n=1 Tax=Halomonas binhaiensis TaxID=2562282 RepID=A0A5C1NFB6_9GAMM|nr:AAA family ATPase [Halomonas binhaiensis]QEM82422.1 AAA family ATPase [Halomonas binhaiensis]